MSRTNEPELYKPPPKREVEIEHKPSAEWIDNCLKVAALDKYERFKSGRVWFDFGSPTYDYLVNRGILVMETETRRAIFEQAKKEVAMGKGMPPSMANKRQIDERALGIELTAKSRAKKISLDLFFQECQDHEFDLKNALGL